MRIIYGGAETLLNVINPCRMDVKPSVALDMNQSPH